MKCLALLVAILASSWPTTSYAAPKPLRVWLYGDGESGRMLSELKSLLPTGITVTRKSPMETTGPVQILPSQPPSVADRLLADLLATPAQSLPNLIHIGYNASAWSLTYCTYTAPSKTESVWKQEVQQYALDEAKAINDAADVATFFGIKVLLSKGPGAASKSAAVKLPLAGTTAAQKIQRSCMTDAFWWTSWDLAGLNTYLWMDYSGMTVDPRLSATANPVSQRLDPMNVWHWEQDGIHISSDKLKYDGQDPPKSPIVGYAGSFTVGTGTGKVPQASLGAYRVALNVCRAYLAIQAQL